MWLRMVLVAFRLVWPYVFTPWRSPLLRWRLETYGITDSTGRLLHADELTTAQCFTFVRTHASQLLAFLRWASRL